MVDIDVLSSKVRCTNLAFHAGNSKGKWSSLVTTVTALETQCRAGIWSALILSEQ